MAKDSTITQDTFLVSAERVGRDGSGNAIFGLVTVHGSYRTTSGGGQQASSIRVPGDGHVLPVRLSMTPACRVWGIEVTGEPFEVRG